MSASALRRALLACAAGRPITEDQRALLHANKYALTTVNNRGTNGRMLDRSRWVTTTVLSAAGKAAL